MGTLPLKHLHGVWQCRDISCDLVQSAVVHAKVVELFVIWGILCTWNVGVHRLLNQGGESFLSPHLTKARLTPKILQWRDPPTMTPTQLFPPRLMLLRNRI